MKGKEKEVEMEHSEERRNKDTKVTCRKASKEEEGIHACAHKAQTENWEKFLYLKRWKLTQLPL